ncbi:hypothetical protein OGAPHI_001717 [Ogataea philodendri]|uniref:Ribosomal RNA-processing protein 7 n=1 Tax=Ogataea philodendri TaxID=1378263 RepID=A0A9P8P9A6_9ASCO|nr:uncharacterized protein OGAPHI_001717 [Ogataea philodendri]KAH3667963.1 hypothetical protein OGAPHI_001717 [Ogataea philodendri]
MSSQSQIKGYTVFPVVFEASKHTKKALHYMFIKKHVTKSVPEAQSRSLFVVNIPVGSTVKDVRKVFGAVATGAIVESLETNDYFDERNLINYELDIDLTKLTNEEMTNTEEKSRVPVGCAVVTFVDKPAMNLALSAIRKLMAASNPKYPVWKPEYTTGSKRYAASKKLDPIQLAQQVEQAMVEFQQREQELKEELNNMQSLVDEDGFTLVVGSHRKTKNGILGSLKRAADLEQDEKLTKKMKKKEKQDFYRFQIREKKKLEMNDLLNKFKEDQERVRQMKEKRQFKPL